MFYGNHYNFSHVLERILRWKKTWRLIHLPIIHSKAATFSYKGLVTLRNLHPRVYIILVTVSCLFSLISSACIPCCKVKSHAFSPTLVY